MRRRLGTVCVVVGILLVLGATALAGWNYMESERVAKSSADVLTELLKAIPEHAERPIEPSEMKTVEIDGYEYIGYLSIPALNLKLPVMSEWDYTRLKIAPCRYYGSVYTKDFVIAAHNYARHFGKLAKLSVGDTVLFTDVNGTVYYYTVEELLKLPPTATEEMISSGWDLTLYTCTKGGQNRVTVRCSLVTE